MKKLFMAFAVGSVLLIAIDSYAFRCGLEIVNTGDSTAIVLLKCGEPFNKSVTKVYTKGKYAGETWKGSTSGSYEEETEIVETWYYNCGPTNFIYKLIFQGDVLKKIDTAGRGNLKSSTSCT